ncbi:unnamed protein product [Microthlaspi erraticum]|uniref:RNase H type-1 domain-containing protein n=1 Tax=Microthlaspi erraticum TaxID=1685480 RepID=A0A6D2ILR2_9BRAS|nr:unnamed protein product [Microthlaspi erraticum]
MGNGPGETRDSVFQFIIPGGNYNIGGCLSGRWGVEGFRTQSGVRMTELEALLWAMQCMLRHNNLLTIFQTDCSDVVKMVSKPEE